MQEVGDDGKEIDRYLCVFGNEDAMVEVMKDEGKKAIHPFIE